ncbi:glycosyltransferase family 22 protein [Tortispora caseinolytica NRRL Y-17796]|uniref:Mannosyltransferase n=1 Tax=Tortispora caseinolytica NRRL Y-17796 TaxID=767744 RepID=A0A1E4TCS9_9ASCO|nr:glycosyltransferase family 22 protein [Tortispora caseinolytica NRRL Y-17796]
MYPALDLTIPASESSAEITTVPSTFHTLLGPWYMPIKVPSFSPASALSNVSYYALYIPILDCDEVYNYWEPLHYFVHHSGFQTWEYSPQYGIRSWFYIAVHSPIINIGKKLAVSRLTQFYSLRIFLSIISALSEFRLFLALKRVYSLRMASIYLAFTTFACGMSHAAGAFLPSSFAMYTSTIALAYFIEGKLEACYVFTAIGALIGWPFAAISGVPFLLSKSVLNNGFKALAKIAVLVAIIVAYDTSLYGTFTFVPWNIVKYNVFSQSSSSGPNIFGTESADFYFKNLVLNFNIVFPLALLSPVFAFTRSGAGRRCKTLACFASTTLTLLAFTLQDHKEERFLYIIYPALSCNAALTVMALLDLVKAAQEILITSAAAAFISVIFMLYIPSSAALISYLRSSTLIAYYNAPLYVYPQIPPNSTVCIGKEWYRFPSSFLVPDNVETYFIESGFDGLLPGKFTVPDGQKLMTFITPIGMNDQNIKEPAHLVPETNCDYIVDLDMPSSPSIYMNAVFCRDFLDSAASSGPGRLIRIPNPAHRITQTLLTWGRYCVYQTNKEVAA